MHFPEEVLFNESLVDLESKNISTKDVVQLIKDIVTGLDKPNLPQDQQFWETKLVYNLLTKVLSDRNKLHTTYKYEAPLSWNLFFQLILESNMLKTLITLTLSLTSLDLLSIIILKWIEYVKDPYIFVIFHISLVSFIALSQKSTLNTSQKFGFELNDMLTHSHKAFAKLCKASSYARFAPKILLKALAREKFYLENIEPTLPQPVFDLTMLNDINKLLSSTSYTSMDFQINFELLQKVTAERQSSQQWKENKVCPEINIFMQKHIQDFQKSCHLMFFSNKTLFCQLTNLMKSLELLLDDNYLQSNQSLPIPNFPEKPNIKSSLFKITYLLEGYQESTSYVIQTLLKNELNKAEFNACLDCLQKMKECLMDSSHCENILTLLKMKLNSCSNTAVTADTVTQIRIIQDILIHSFDSIPITLRISLLQKLFCYKCENYNDNNNCVDILVEDVLDKIANHETKKRINIIFNTMVANFDKEEIVKSICNAAVMSPRLTVKKIVEQVLNHEEHHQQITYALIQLPFVALQKSADGNNLMLQEMCKCLTIDQSDKSVRIAMNFLKLLISPVSCCGINDLVSSLIHILLLSVSYFPENQHPLPFRSAVLLLGAVYDDKHFWKNVSNSDLLLVSYNLCLNIESTTMSDDLLGTIKGIVPVTVNLAATNIANENTDEQTKLLIWTQQLIASLDWSTQIYYLHLLKAHNFMLPASLSTVCNFPEELKYSLINGFGEGTGLTAWLQCMLVDPGFIPLSCLESNFKSVQEQDMFCNGMVVALSQVLPFSIELDWDVILNVLVSLIISDKLFVPLNQKPVQCLCEVDTKPCNYLMSIFQLLNRVTLVLASPCCKNWMSAKLWSRFCRCFSVALKDLVQRCLTTKKIDKHLHFFILCNLYVSACNLIVLLESLKDLHLSQACGTTYVLVLDLASDFNKLFAIVTESENSSMTLAMRREVTNFTSTMIEVTELLGDKQNEITLIKTIRNIYASQK